MARAILDAVRLVGTPCYVTALAPLRENLERLESALERLPVRHFLSAKTQPIRPLFEVWNDWGRCIEVVSEYELAAAIEVGFAPEDSREWRGQTFVASQVSPGKS